MVSDTFNGRAGRDVATLLHSLYLYEDDGSRSSSTCTCCSTALLYGLTRHYKHPNIYLRENLCVSETLYQILSDLGPKSVSEHPDPRFAKSASAQKAFLTFGDTCCSQGTAVKWYGLKTDPYGTPYLRTEDDGEDKLSSMRRGEQRKV